MNNKKVSKIKFNKRQIWQVAFTAMTASALMAVDERATIRLIQEETQEAMGRFRQETNEQMSTRIRKINNNGRFKKEHNRVLEKIFQETDSLQAMDLSREERHEGLKRLRLRRERLHATSRERRQSYLAERTRLREELQNLQW